MSTNEGAVTPDRNNGGVSHLTLGKREKGWKIMIRAKIWFRCAAMHDPVMPILVKPAVVGWQGKHRVIDLVIERGFSGSELIRRMKGWITVDPKEAISVFEKHGRLKCFDNGELVVELEDRENLEALQNELAERFKDQCDVEAIAPRG